MSPKRDAEKWTRRPADHDMPLTYLVNRAGPKGHSPCIILSGDVVGGYVHFIRGRSVKCPDNECAHCDNNTERRWRGYLVVADARSRELSLLELTAAAMRPIDTYFRKHRTLRGALLETKRVPEKANGRLYSLITESAINVDSFPAVPSVKSLLRKLWCLPSVASDNGEVERKIRLHDDDQDICSA